MIVAGTVERRGRQLFSSCKFGKPDLKLPLDRVLNWWVIGLLAELSRPVNRRKMNQQPGCLILLRGPPHGSRFPNISDSAHRKDCRNSVCGRKSGLVECRPNLCTLPIVDRRITRSTYFIEKPAEPFAPCDRA